MIVNQGCKISVAVRGDAILTAIFGEQKNEEGMDSEFAVFNSQSNNCGKIYLSIHTSLQTLVDAELPFKWVPDVRETKVVIHY